MSSKISGLAFSVLCPRCSPEDGRLILSEAQVNANYLKQINKTEEHKTNCSKQAGFRIGFTCNQSLHISLFLMVQIIMNIMTLPDTQPILPNCFIRPIRTQKNRDILTTIYRVVGTPFPKIGEMDYSNSGLEFATGGEDLINWALLRLVDALSYSIDPSHKRLDDNVAKSTFLLCALPGL